MTLTGRNLATTAHVLFNGVAAVFRIDSGGQLTAIVPEGAATGPIRIETPGGGVTSLNDFSVGEVRRATVEPCCRTDKPRRVWPR